MPSGWPGSRPITSGTTCSTRKLGCLSEIDRIRHIPATIVQGRYDIVCPIVTADALHRAWPEARYVVVPDAGHSAMEPGIRSALIEASQRFRGLPTSS